MRCKACDIFMDTAKKDPRTGQDRDLCTNCYQFSEWDIAEVFTDHQEYVQGTAHEGLTYSKSFQD